MQFLVAACIVACASCVPNIPEQADWPVEYFPYPPADRPSRSVLPPFFPPPPVSPLTPYWHPGEVPSGYKEPEVVHTPAEAHSHRSESKTADTVNEPNVPAPTLPSLPAIPPNYLYGLPPGTALPSTPYPPGVGELTGAELQANYGPETFASSFFGSQILQSTPSDSEKAGGVSAAYKASPDTYFKSPITASASDHPATSSEIPAPYEVDPGAYFPYDPHVTYPYPPEETSASQPQPRAVDGGGNTNVYAGSTGKRSVEALSQEADEALVAFQKALDRAIEASLTNTRESSSPNSYAALFDEASAAIQTQHTPADGSGKQQESPAEATTGSPTEVYDTVSVDEGAGVTTVPLGTLDIFARLPDSVKDLPEVRTAQQAHETLMQSVLALVATAQRRETDAANYLTRLKNDTIKRQREDTSPLPTSVTADQPVTSPLPQFERQSRPVAAAHAKLRGEARQSLLADNDGVGYGLRVRERQNIHSTSATTLKPTDHSRYSHSDRISHSSHEVDSVHSVPPTRPSWPEPVSTPRPLPPMTESWRDFISAQTTQSHQPHPTVAPKVHVTAETSAPQDLASTPRVRAFGGRQIPPPLYIRKPNERKVPDQQLGPAHAQQHMASPRRFHHPRPRPQQIRQNPAVTTHADRAKPMHKLPNLPVPLRPVLVRPIHLRKIPSSSDQSRMVIPKIPILTPTIQLRQQIQPDPQPDEAASPAGTVRNERQRIVAIRPFLPWLAPDKQPKDTTARVWNAPASQVPVQPWALHSPKLSSAQPSQPVSRHPLVRVLKPDINLQQQPITIIRRVDKNGRTNLVRINPSHPPSLSVQPVGPHRLPIHAILTKPPTEAAPLLPLVSQPSVTAQLHQTQGQRLIHAQNTPGMSQVLVPLHQRPSQVVKVDRDNEPSVQTQPFVRTLPRFKIGADTSSQQNVPLPIQPETSSKLPLRPQIFRINQNRADGQQKPFFVVTAQPMPPSAIPDVISRIITEVTSSPIQQPASTEASVHHSKDRTEIPITEAILTPTEMPVVDTATGSRTEVPFQVQFGAVVAEETSTYAPEQQKSGKPPTADVHVSTGSFVDIEPTLLEEQTHPQIVTNPMEVAKTEAIATPDLTPEPEPVPEPLPEPTTKIKSKTRTNTQAMIESTSHNQLQEKSELQGGNNSTGISDAPSTVDTTTIPPEPTIRIIRKKILRKVQSGKASAQADSTTVASTADSSAITERPNLRKVSKTVSSETVTKQDSGTMHDGILNRPEVIAARKLHAMLWRQLFNLKADMPVFNHGQIVPFTSGEEGTYAQHHGYANEHYVESGEVLQTVLADAREETAGQPPDAVSLVSESSSNQVKPSSTTAAPVETTTHSGTRRPKSTSRKRSRSRSSKTSSSRKRKSKNTEGVTVEEVTEKSIPEAEPFIVTAQPINENNPSTELASGSKTVTNAKASETEKTVAKDAAASAGDVGKSATHSSTADSATASEATSEAVAADGKTIVNVPDIATLLASAITHRPITSYPAFGQTSPPLSDHALSEIAAAAAQGAKAEASPEVGSLDSTQSVKHSISTLQSELQDSASKEGQGIGGETPLHLQTPSTVHREATRTGFSPPSQSHIALWRALEGYDIHGQTSRWQPSENP